MAEALRASLRAARERDLETLRELREDDDDGCSACGGFSHPDGECEEGGGRHD